MCYDQSYRFINKCEVHNNSYNKGEKKKQKMQKVKSLFPPPLAQTNKYSKNMRWIPVSN